YRCGAFFFQAEDGIRDFHVTGVQTCALPILMAQSVIQAGTIKDVSIHALPGDVQQYLKSGNDLIVQMSSGDSILVQGFYTPAARSEERRVGKEGRSGRAPYALKEDNALVQKR